jgi:AbrB family looped-hinge helix DNA binding protein
MVLKNNNAINDGRCHMTLQVNITPNGRMSLPVGIRKRLGLEGGGAVLVEETSEGVILRTVDQAVAKAQAIAKRFADHPESSVDAFLTARRSDSGE